MIPLKLIITIIICGISILLLFFINISSLFGSVYQQSLKAHALNILMVDYDQGIIGQSMIAAYQKLAAPSFPTCTLRNSSQYPTTESILDAINRREFWAAIYTTPTASSSLVNALWDGAAYNASNSIIYIWDSLRYPGVSSSIISPAMMELVGATSHTYHSINGTEALASLDTNSSTALATLLDPISAVGIDIHPSAQQEKFFYNTLCTVIPILQQFLFLMAFNNIVRRFNSNLNPEQAIIVRAATGIIYTFCGALSMTGYIYLFQDDLSVSADKFALLWMLLWLLMHIYYLVIELALSFLPIPIIPYMIVTFILVNVTSTLNPFELTPGWYRWQYALPAFEGWQIQMDILGGGPSTHLYQALPILFSWYENCCL